MGKDRLATGPGILLLLLCLLPGEVSASTAEPQYLVMVPFLIHTETSEKICIHLSHLNETVTLRADFYHLAVNKSLMDDMVIDKDFFGCIPFTVPKWFPSSTRVTLRIEVKGPTHQFRSERKVLIRDHGSLTFVQTDKPIYKPGQKVLFRIVSLNEQFLPLNEMFPLVYIQDPNRNRLIQWRDVQLHHGLARLSFPLASEPPLGDYTVIATRTSGGDVQRQFSVNEYVLPKFEVSVKVPKIMSVMEEELKVTVCGRYTYGKAVPGTVKVQVCRHFMDGGSQCPRNRHLVNGVCEEFSGEADAHGCLSRVVQTAIFQMMRKGYHMNIQVTANITEEGTGVELTGTGSTELTTVLSKLTLENREGDYKQGVPYMGKMKLEDGTHMPIANATIQLQYGAAAYKVNYTTDDQGIALFSINTDNLTDQNLNIHAVYKEPEFCYSSSWVNPSHQKAFLALPRVYSPNGNYLHIQPVYPTLRCESTQTFQIHYILNPDNVPEKIHLHYLMVSKWTIVNSGIHTEPLEHGQAKGVANLELYVDSHVAPELRLFVYVPLPSGQMLVDTNEFPVEKCFSNKVKMAFSAPEGLPGGNTQLHVTASKDSLCAIRAVDKSVLLLKPEAELSPQTVYALLPTLSNYDYQYNYLDESNVEQCVPPKNIIVDGIQYYPVAYKTISFYRLMRGLGLKVFTNAQLQHPEICAQRGYSDSPMPVAARRYYSSPEMAESISMGLAGPGGRQTYTSETEAAKPIRSFFPETWLWLETSVNSDGQADVPVTIPDTITEWTADAFCTSAEAGFGLAQPIPLKAFQPFFVDLTLPYSMVRGEAFHLKATVFTYLPHCIRVSVSLAPSSDFEASLLGNAEESYCLCPNERQTVAWTFTPKSLGEVNIAVTAESVNSEHLCGNEIVQALSEGQTDTVIKSILVEPEGVEKEVVFNSLVCKAGEKATPVSLKVPENVVEGSARASFCVLGDILGSAVQNLHQLLRLPYGCGEQNMALFAPNIYILDYLNKTDQLTEEIQSKAISYLVSGYQRQLNYRLYDGSYSTFGQGDPPNTWLTAFVLKSFGQARRYVFIENKHIIEAQHFLSATQQANGCFRRSGHLLNNALKGGVDNEVSLSAYITIALLESSLEVTHPLLRNALFCLETAAEGKKDVHVYTQALLAYAFALAGKEEKRKEMLTFLEEAAVKEEDSSIHWQRPDQQPEKVNHLFYQPQAPSAEVEMTSYVLLAYLTERPAPSQEALMKASNIVRWLSKQQNPTGGFSSTQDTVVALQALSQYGASTYSKHGTHSEVKLLSGSDVQHQFQVDSSNRLLLQCGPVTGVPGEYSTEVTGDGCVHVQTTLKYNVHSHHEEEPFTLEVHTVPETCKDPKAERVFDVALNVSYTGQRLVSNMAIVDVKMLSGFIPVKSSVKNLERHGQVKRTEVSTNHVLIYLEQVNNATQTYSFTVEQEMVVQDLKPAVVKVYDYYETDEFAEAEYDAPCSTGDVKQKKE
ncbi:alpha-2-macroglobulin [Sphaerodactylus townsendi]|uniref:alpha-2-macroglobulin n=1 Tax=Sphaerodactylus townsendi TaxID=933632 RepID=UPI0020266FA6|nr:alpha-2-macroglobulin [Sphaerodactylus townsendi]